MGGIISPPGLTFYPAKGEVAVVVNQGGVSPLAINLQINPALGQAKLALIAIQLTPATATPVSSWNPTDLEFVDPTYTTAPFIMESFYGKDAAGFITQCRSRGLFTMPVDSGGLVKMSMQDAFNHDGSVSFTVMGVWR